MSRALRSRARDAIAECLLRSGLTRPDRRLRGCLSILTFHRVLPEEERNAYPLPGLVVTPEELEWLLRYFGRSFHCGSLAESARRWEREPDAEMPSLAITFDDGQHDNWQFARPILDRLGVHASFFVPVESALGGEPLWHDRIAWAVHHASVAHPAEAAQLARALAPSAGDALPAPRDMVVLAKAMPAAERDRCLESWEILAGDRPAPYWDGFMGWEELRSLAQSGHEIGSHSMSHSILPLCSTEEIEREVRDSREILESRLDHPVETFCYPNGDHDARCLAAVRDAGYRQAVTTSWGTNRLGASPFEMRRFDMTSEHSYDGAGGLSAARVAWRVSGLHPGLG